jgi:hypothetical protein
MLEYNIRSKEDLKNELKENVNKLANILNKENNLGIEFLQKRAEENLFSTLPNLDEMAVKIAKEKIEEKIENSSIYDNTTPNHVIIQIEIGYDLENDDEYFYPNKYPHDILLESIKNNPSALIEKIETNNKTNLSINDELANFYTIGAKMLIEDIANDLNLNKEELNLGDLKEIYNKIETDLEKKEPSYDEFEIETDRFNYNREKENREKEMEY